VTVDIPLHPYFSKRVTVPSCNSKLEKSTLIPQQANNNQSVLHLGSARLKDILFDYQVRLSFVQSDEGLQGLRKDRSNSIDVARSSAAPYRIVTLGERSSRANGNICFPWFVIRAMVVFPRATALLAPVRSRRRRFAGVQVFVPSPSLPLSRWIC